MRLLQVIKMGKSKAQKARAKFEKQKQKQSKVTAKNNSDNRKAFAPKNANAKKPNVKSNKNNNVKPPVGKKGAKPTITPVGRTLITADKYLPIIKGKSQELKDERWVVVIDKNTNEELAVVRLTSQNQANTTYLPTYKHGNMKETYFKNFVEIEDNEGNPIVVDNVKFKANNASNNLTKDELKTVQTTVRAHCVQAQSNSDKIEQLYNRVNINDKSK